MKRTTIYIVFCVSVILVFLALVFKLDTDAVRDLEYKFNHQQSIQIDLAKRSIEEQFSWQVNNIGQITKELSILVEYYYIYDTSSQRMLYSAKSINQVSMDIIEGRLDAMIATAPKSDVLTWGVIGKSYPVILPVDDENPNNSLYASQLVTWFKDYESDINRSEVPYITPIYASPDDQFIGVFHHINTPDGQRLGVMGAIIDLRPLIDQFIVPIRSGQYGAAWLQDFDGQVVFDHEPEIIGHSVYDLHAAYPEVLALDHRYPREPSGTAEYSFTVQRGGKVNRKLMAWNTAVLGNQKLTVALSAPDTEISALLSGSRQTSLFLALTLTVLLVGSGGVFYSFQQTELRRLVQERTYELEKEHNLLLAEIADRKKVENALRNSETNFRQLAESVREVFFLFDVAANKTLYVSPAYESVWKRNGLEIQKSPFRLLKTVYSEDRSEVYEQIRTFWSQPSAVSAEFRIVAGDGDIRWIRWRAFPFSKDDIMERLICTAEDITLQKHAHEAEISIELERKRTQLLAGFVQAAFHEFRTPLSIINTSVYLLGNVQDVQRRNEYLQFIRDESANIMHLVEQLVAMSRLDVEEPFVSERVHVDTMMNDLQIMMEPEIRAANLKSTWSLDAEAKYVYGDSEQLHRAIKNILENAIKYSNPDDMISVTTHVKNQFICIEIEDTGEGIDSVHLDSIFERFYRIDKAHSTRGFGLGLPIAQQIIERHHGTITVESTAGQGSLFRVMIPIDTEESKAAIVKQLP